MTDCDHDKKSERWEVTTTRTSGTSIKMSATASVDDSFQVGPEAEKYWEKRKSVTDGRVEDLCKRIEICTAAQDELLLAFHDLQQELETQLGKENIKNDEIFKELKGIKNTLRPQANDLKRRVKSADIDRQTLEDFWKSAEQLESTISEWQDHVVDKWDYRLFAKKMNSANRYLMENDSVDILDDIIDKTDRINTDAEEIPGTEKIPDPEDLPLVEETPEIGQMLEMEKEICNDLQKNVVINLEENYDITERQLQERYNEEEQRLEPPEKSQSKDTAETEEEKQKETQNRRQGH